MSREPKEDYDWINDPFDEKKIAEERERMGMSGFIVLIGLLLFGIL